MAEAHAFGTPEIPGFVEDLAQRGHGLGRGRAQRIGVHELEPIGIGGQPGEVAQAVGERVPVVAEPVREAQRARDACEQLGLVGAAGEVDAMRLERVWII